VKSRYVSFLAFATVLVLLNLPFPASLRIRSSACGNTAPFHSAMRLLQRYAGNAWEAMGNRRRDVREVDRLRENLAQARYELASLEDLVAENRELRRLVDFRSRSRHHVILSEVLSRGGMGGWWQTLRIDKGRRHGVGVNMAVVDRNGLIGRTGGGSADDASGPGPGLALSDTTSDVLLITDPTSKIACMVGEAGYFGILRGAGTVFPFEPEMEMLAQPAAFEVEYIPRNAAVREGDEVVTAGTGGSVPRGIRIGFVRHVAQDASGLYLRAVVRPVANLRNPRHVFVVLHESRVAPSSLPAGAAP
jgi:rod shape-determining protein MreC